MAKEVAEEYASSLADLTVNSKPLINMLTILAEENVEHAGVIVDTVVKHLEKVNPEIKLPVLYLVDSIIKNVSGAYVQKFSDRIVNMFTRTFKQVDEKTRSQMFKLRETWHDVFPATKLYQLDVKVNLIDPAWPIQAQPVVNNHGHQPAIHVNPNFLKKPAATTSAAQAVSEEERMKQVLAKKEQELLLLQRKKIEMELEATRRQLELAEKQAKKVPLLAVTTPAALAVAPAAPAAPSDIVPLPAKARLGPPVPKPAGASRIAPVSAALVAARRDPRLQRTAAVAPPPPPQLAQSQHQPIAPNVFDIKPLDRVTKRKNVITFDVPPQLTDRQTPRDPRRRDPRADKPRPDRRERDKTRDRKRDDKRTDVRPDKKLDKPDVNVNNHKDNHKDNDEKEKDKDKLPEKDLYTSKYQIPDPKKINKLPPIPKINRDENRDKDAPSPVKKRKEAVKNDKKKVKESKSPSSNSSPEKKSSPEKRKNRDKKAKTEVKEKMKQEEEMKEEDDDEMIAFKELKNYHKEHYMRRNREKSESPDLTAKNQDAPMETDVSNVAESESTKDCKDIDLRVLPSVVELKPAIVQKRPSTETVEVTTKKTKLDKFDILFGNEDVDLRQLPQVEELPVVTPAPAPALAPLVTPAPVNVKAPESPEMTKETNDDETKEDDDESPSSPLGSPKKDWHEVKDKTRELDVVKKTPTKLDLVRAKLAEATKGKDRLGRPLLFGKSPSVERERRRTISSEDTDLRAENPTEFDAEDHKKTISIIMNQAKQQFTDGQLDKNQYNTLMYQVLQLNEKLKLKEAKQRESLELSKMKLKATTQGNIVTTPKRSPHNNYGDIDERIIPPPFMDTPPDSSSFVKDSDMRMPSMPNMPLLDMEPPRHSLLPASAGPPVYNPYSNWRGLRPRNDEYVPRRFRGPNPTQYYRPRFEARPRVPFEPRLPLPPPPTMGMCQGECPLQPYERVSSPPPLGTPSIVIPSTDYRVLEYIDKDPVKTIQIDGVPREIRFYGETAIIMLEWDDPREIKFLPGCRRVTFDNKDSVVLSFNDPYKTVEIDDQTFDIRFGAPTRELYINGCWYECFFGGNPLGAIIDGQPRLIQLEGPLPQVDIGKEKRTDLVAGKINLIVNATQMCPVYLDAKVQKFTINNHFFTIRFVDSLRTVLINEVPFKVEYGFLPKPIVIGNEKFFIRFSALPRGIKPGMIQIAGMEGCGVPALPPPVIPFESIHVNSMDVDEEIPRPPKTPSPEGENQGLDLLASVMPSSIEAPASASAYSLAEPLFCRPDKIPGLETPGDDKPSANLTILGNINVTDLFAKLVATGIVAMPNDKKEDVKKEEKVKDSEEKENKVESEKEPEKQESPQKEAPKEPEKPKEDKKIHRVDLLRPQTLRVKQPGMVAKLYGGMQCSGCGARFPPEHTVRYSQHLDWHFRQNRKERDSARRAHSRLWHYDLCDWVQYEEVEDADEREKSWFETGGQEGEMDPPPETESEAPSVAAGAPTEYHCALCGDRFQQFYNEDQEEWHLRNSIRYEDKNYHPMCFDDYKASQAKVAAPVEPSDDVITLDRTEDTIEIREDDNSQSDAESEVEVVEDKQETLEIEDVEEEEDEDDVVFKAEPVVEVEVNDDADTDDETQAERKERDKQAEIDFSKVKVKQEPIDPDDEPIMTAVEEAMTPSVETTTPSVLSSIDGNVQLHSTPATTLPLGGIRINITKTIPTILSAPVDDFTKDLSDISVDEPLPPGEEPELEYKLKPGLEGVELSRQPPVRKGNELSGLCSVM